MEKPPVILAPGRKPKGRLFRTVVGLPLIAFGCMVFLAFLAMPRPPKESKVIQNFYNNRTAFEQLRDMLKEDPHLRRVAGWGVETSNPFYLGDASASGFPMDRYRRYLALLKQAGGTSRHAVKVSTVAQVFSFGHGAGLVIRDTWVSAGWKKPRRIRFQRSMVTMNGANIRGGGLHSSASMKTGIFGLTSRRTNQVHA